MIKAGIELSVESGGFTAGMAAAARSVDTFSQAMEKAKSEKDFHKAANLDIAQSQLKASSLLFNNDTKSLLNDPRLKTVMANGASGIKVDAEKASLFKDLTRSIRELSGKIEEQIAADDIAGAMETTSQLKAKQAEFGRAVQDLTSPAGKKNGQAGAAGFLGAQQISTAINEGFRIWADSFDRAGIVGQFGSGDVFGAHLSERRKDDALIGGGVSTLGNMIGGAMMFNPKTMLAGLGIMLGANIFNAVRQKNTNEKSTQLAYAGLWQQRAAEMMELAALKGTPGDPRGAFSAAAGAANRFGFSAEEGAGLLGQALREGLGGGLAQAVTEQVFKHQRATGADRGALAGIATMSARFGAGDALGAGWAGLNASGMESGQYSEFLRGMQRVMEDGISRGFVRSSEEVAKNLTMLAAMSGNSPLWQGEHGARRLSDMNAGLANATGLGSTSDIVAFRAAKYLAGEGASYLDAMEILEGGVTGDFLNKFMRLTREIEGGDEAAIVERLRQTFGFNYTQARQFNSGWNSGISAEAAERLAQAHGLALPDADSYELQAAKMIAEIQTATITIGQAVWDRYGLDAIKDAYYNRDGEQSGWLPNRRAFANSADARGSMIEDLSKDGGFFDVGSELWPGRRTDAQNADRAARDAIRSMANNAFNSGDADEIGLAKDFSAIIRAVSTETRSQWNSSNKINQLADAGSMAEMLNLLRQLIEATEANGQVNVTYEEY